RRRQAAAAVAGPRGAGLLHARQLRAAHALVQARHGLGSSGGLRHVQGTGAVAAGSGEAQGRLRPTRAVTLASSKFCSLGRSVTKSRPRYWCTSPTRSRTRESRNSSRAAGGSPAIQLLSIHVSVQMGSPYEGTSLETTSSPGGNRLASPCAVML